MKYVMKEVWENIEEVEPDEFDLQMIKEINENPDCKEFVNAKDINWEEL